MNNVWEQLNYRSTLNKLGRHQGSITFREPLVCPCFYFPLIPHSVQEYSQFLENSDYFHISELSWMFPLWLAKSSSSAHSLLFLIRWWQSSLQEANAAWRLCYLWWALFITSPVSCITEHCSFVFSKPQNASIYSIFFLLQGRGPLSMW